MKKFTGLYELGAAVFDSLMWEGMEVIIYAEDLEDTYSISYRGAGSFGAPEHERSILCTVDLSAIMWADSLMEWGIHPDLMVTSEVDEELVRDYIAGALVDHLRYRMEARAEDLEQAAREYEEENYHGN